MTANTWTFMDHILSNAARPRVGDKKSPTQWPSAGTAVSYEGDRKIVFGKCRRQAWYQLLSEHFDYDPEEYEDQQERVATLKANIIPPDNYIRFIWAIGEMYEEYMINQAKCSGVFVHTQVPVYIKAYNISGKIDIIVINPFTLKLSVVEVKSIYGHNAISDIIGTAVMHRDSAMGNPRWGNLIQIALYHWWTASNDDAYEESRLLYGARDTGRYAEFLVKTTTDDDGIIHIWYQGVAPVQDVWKEAPFTLSSVLEEYARTAEQIATREVPDRDFKFVYDRQDVHQAWERGELNRTDSKQYEKILEREEENLQRIADGLAPKQSLKLPEKGDFACNYCAYRRSCYNSDGTPKET